MATGNVIAQEKRKKKRGVGAKEKGATLLLEKEKKKQKTRGEKVATGNMIRVFWLNIAKN